MFTICGVQHTQDVKTKEIILDQIHYVSNMKSIVHPQLRTATAEDDAVPELHQLYMSFLGAVAYLAHTRVDVLVFVSALQRHTHAPKVEQVRKLNELLRWIQHHPEKLTYRRFETHPNATVHMKNISDAAFKRESDDGYSLCGALYLRGGGGLQSDSLAAKHSSVHVVDWACKSERRVTRSTCSAELLSAGDAIDQGMLIARMICEIESGPLTAVEARQKRIEGGYIPMALYVDAMSVFAAVSAAFIKTPAGKFLLCHVRCMRELLDRKVIQYIVWLDTRDVSADG
jgi:hypothetical protein